MMIGNKYNTKKCLINPKEGKNRSKKGNREQIGKKLGGNFKLIY